MAPKQIFAQLWTKLQRRQNVAFPVKDKEEARFPDKAGSGVACPSCGGSLTLTAKAKPKPPAKGKSKGKPATSAKKGEFYPGMMA